MPMCSQNLAGGVEKSVAQSFNLDEYLKFFHNKMLGRKVLVVTLCLLAGLDFLSCALSREQR